MHGITAIKKQTLWKHMQGDPAQISDWWQTMLLASTCTFSYPECEAQMWGKTAGDNTTTPVSYTHLASFPCQASKYQVYQSLKCCQCIRESKWHDAQ